MLVPVKKTPPKGPKMLNPVELPLPVALAVLACLAAAALYRLRPEAAPVRADQPPGRHRLESIAEPYRPQPPRSALTVRQETSKWGGASIWSLSDDARAADTRELAAAR